jgi:hypothetical protein
MSGFDDFGGLVGFWKEGDWQDGGPSGGRAMLARVGHGALQGHPFGLTPLNLLQSRKLIDALIEQGREKGYITAEHERVAAQLPMTDAGKDPMPRSEVNRIAGEL